ncbi:phosphate/phosphite/phosphonate ABC transporter substrate-binding protein [Phytobacter sp. SCO41]|uniref:Phosphate/phosphite/phosphonate ABC transporter substrate-binding protein n=1 Tax=Citrobacter bitternis TaxID=1585982 RepID=A0ABW1Q4Q6_9ENTR|nr:PhnD/SsuA/transferrin family substrate-binding protein [Phytobacter sp. SCO41]
MRHEVAFPMYDLHRPDTLALIRAVSERLAAKGITVNAVWPQEALLSHWRSDALLLSQTCGFPLVTQLPDVQTVGCFHYSAPGCDGFHYRSLLVTREENTRPTLADFRGRVAACNSVDSQSGYNALRKMVAPLAEGGAFFSSVVLSGSHRQSLVAIGQRRADIAAIDCVSWALLARHEPELLAGLVVIGSSPLAPGLPLITAKQTSAQSLLLLQEALFELVNDARYQAVCDALLITGFSPVAREAYSPLLAWRDEAAALGVTQL